MHICLRSLHAQDLPCASTVITVSNVQRPESARRCPEEPSRLDGTSPGQPAT